MLNKIEKDVFSKFLFEEVRLSFSESKLELIDRTYTGVGFFTEIRTPQNFPLLYGGQSSVWGKVGATLNFGIEAGFLIFIDKGIPRAIEGYTYGEQSWPSSVKNFELYNL